MGPLLGMLASTLAQHGINYISDALMDKSPKIVKDVIKVVNKKTEIDLSKVGERGELLTKEQINKLKDYDREFRLTEYQGILKDRTKAREAELLRQQTGTRLTKNTGSVIALVVVSFTLFLSYEIVDFIFDILKNPKSSISPQAALLNSIITFILGGLFGMMGNIIQFYYGPGKTEADKQRLHELRTGTQLLDGTKEGAEFVVDNKDDILDYKKGMEDINKTQIVPNTDIMYFNNSVPQTPKDPKPTGVAKEEKTKSEKDHEKRVNQILYGIEDEGRL